MSSVSLLIVTTFFSLLECTEHIYGLDSPCFVFIPSSLSLLGMHLNCVDLFFFRLWVIFFSFAYLVIFIIFQPINFMPSLTGFCCIPESVGFSWGAHWVIGNPPDCVEALL